MPLPNLLRIIATIVSSLLTVLAAATVCFACDCETLSPPESFKAADLVFVGNVVASDPAAQVNTTFRNTTLRVEQVLKGTANDQVVITGMSNCDFPFQTGHSYIVYARQSDGKFFAGICMSTKAIRGGPSEQPLIHYASPPRYGYRVIVTGVLLLLALAVGYIVGRAWPRAA